MFRRLAEKLVGIRRRICASLIHEIAAEAKPAASNPSGSVAVNAVTAGASFETRADKSTSVDLSFEVPIG